MFEKPYVLIVGDENDFETPKLLAEEYSEKGFFSSIALGSIPSAEPRTADDIEELLRLMAGSIRRGRYNVIAFCGRLFSREYIKALETLGDPKLMRPVEIVDHTPPDSKPSLSLERWKRDRVIYVF